MHEQVAPRGPAQHGQAEPAQTKDLTGLGAGRDFQVGGAALDQRNLNAGAKCRLGETHGDLVPQVVVVTLESWIVGDDELDVEVASLSTASGRLPPAGQTEATAGGDTGGHVHLAGDFLGHRAGARTQRAEALHDGALSPAPPAVGGGHHRAEHGPSRDPDLTRSATVRACHRAGPRFGSGPLTIGAACPRGVLDVDRAAERRQLERDLRADEDVAAAASATPSRAGSEQTVTEHRPQQVVEAGEAPEEVFEVDGVAAVVAATRLRVGEDLIGFGCLPEPGGGLRVVRIHVRVGLPGDLPERLLDLLGSRVPVDPENPVVVAGHQSVPEPIWLSSSLDTSSTAEMARR